MCDEEQVRRQVEGVERSFALKPLVDQRWSKTERDKNAAEKHCKLDRIIELLEDQMSIMQEAAAAAGLFKQPMPDTAGVPRKPAELYYNYSVIETYPWGESKGSYQATSYADCAAKVEKGRLTQAMPSSVKITYIGEASGAY